MAEGVGAFMLCALLITAAGFTGWFARVMDRIPVSLASALLAGVLARFAFDGFAALQREKLLVGVMLVAYLLGRRWWPRYAVPGVLAAGMAVAAWQGQLHWGAVQWQLATPEFTMPQFSLAAAVGIALPLFVVTMASQNLPGVAAQRAAGYDTPVSPVLTTTGLATLVLAPFGGYALNLAAITAAICMGRPAPRGRHAQLAGRIQDLLPGGGVHRHALAAALRAAGAFGIAGHLHRAEALARRAGLHPVDEGQGLGFEAALAQRGGVDQHAEHAVEDAHLVAFAHALRHARGQRAAQQFAHRGQAVALVAAEGQQRAQRRHQHAARVLRRLALVVDQAARRHRLALVVGHAGLALGDDAGREVQDHRRAPGSGTPAQNGLVPKRASAPP
jgi:hypothetical protein